MFIVRLGMDPVKSFLFGLIFSMIIKKNIFLSRNCTVNIYQELIIFFLINKDNINDTRTHRKYK